MSTFAQILKMLTNPLTLLYESKNHGAMVKYLNSSLTSYESKNNGLYAQIFELLTNPPTFLYERLHVQIFEQLTHSLTWITMY